MDFREIFQIIGFCCISAIIALFIFMLASALGHKRKTDEPNFLLYPLFALGCIFALASIPLFVIFHFLLKAYERENIEPRERDARRTGFDEGLETGKIMGHKEGYEDGDWDGFHRGYKAGYRDGYNDCAKGKEMDI